MQKQSGFLNDNNASAIPADKRLAKYGDLTKLLSAQDLTLLPSTRLNDVSGGVVSNESSRFPLVENAS